MAEPDDPRTQDGNSVPRPRPRRRVGRWLLLALLLPVVLATAVIGWVATTESGLSTLASVAARLSNGALTLEGVQGRLAGPVRIERLALKTPTLQVAAEAIALDWRWRALRERRLWIDALRIERLRVATADSDEPATLPETLALPIPVHVESLRIDRLELAMGTLPKPQPAAPGAAPATPTPGAAPTPTAPAAIPEPLVVAGIEARVDSDGSTRHRLDRLRATTPWGAAEGEATVGAQRPFPLQARATLQGELPVTDLLQDLPKDLPRDVRIEATADGSLDRMTVSADGKGALDASVRAVVEPFAPVPIERADATVRDFDPSRWRAGLPAARLTIRARLTPSAPSGSSTPSTPTAPTSPTSPRDWVVEGPIEIDNAAPGRIDAQRIPVERIAARLRWQADRLTLESLDAQLAGGGRVAGDARWASPAAGASGPGEAQAQLRLEAVDLAALHSALRSTRLSGTVQGRADAQAQSVEANLVEPRFRAVVDARHADRVVELRTLRLTARDALLEGRGRIALDGARPFAFDGRLAGFDPSLWLAQSPKASLTADLSASGSLPPQGDPIARVRFALGDSRLDGKPLAGRGVLAIDGSRVHDADVDLDLAGNRVQARGAFGRPGDEIVLRVDAPALGALGLPVSGALQADARLRGALAAPSGELRVEGGRLVLPGDVRIGKVALSATLQQGIAGDVSADLAAQGVQVGEGAGALRVRDVAAQLRGTLAAHALQATVRGLRDYDIAARVQGGLTRGAAPIALAGVGAGAAAKATAGRAGDRNVSVPARGPVDPGADATALVGAFIDGAAHWRGRLEQLELSGPESLRLTQPATLVAGRDAVRIADARLLGPRGGISLEELAWTPRAWATRGSISDAPLPPELMSALPMLNSTLRVSGRWDLRARDAIEGTARIERTAGDLVVSAGAAGGEGDIALGLSDLVVDVTADGRRVIATARAAGARLGTLDGRAAIALVRGADGRWTPSRDAPVDATLSVSVPSLDWLGPVVDPQVRTAGRLSAQLRVEGSARAPRISGRVEGDDLRVALLEQGIDLADGRVRLVIDESLLTLQEAVFSAPIRQRPRERRLDLPANIPPGQLRAQGSIRIAGPGAGQGLVRVQIDRLAALQSPDRWLMLSGNAALTLEADRLVLTGDLLSDAGAFQIAGGGDDRPELSDDVVVIRRGAAAQGRAGSSSGTDRGGKPGEPPKAGLPLMVDLSVDLGNRTYVRGRGLDARLAGSVQVRGRVGGTLIASGTVSTVDGVYEAYNQRLAIERGVINFQGPLENPGLNIRAVRRGLPVEAGVEVTGTVQSPRVRLVSTPNVPDAEKLSWLVLGQPPGQISGREQELLGQAALALLSGESGGRGTELLKSLGIEFGMRSGPSGAPGSTTLARIAAMSPGSARTATDRIVTIGRRLSSKAYVGIEQSLTSSMTLLQLSYQLSRRLSTIARTGAENSVDLIYTWSYR